MYTVLRGAIISTNKRAGKCLWWNRLEKQTGTYYTFGEFGVYYYCVLFILLCANLQQEFPFIWRRRQDYHSMLDTTLRT